MKPLLSLVSCVWFDDLGAKYQFFLDNQEASVVKVCATVVCAACDGDTLLGSEPINTVRAHLVSSDDETYLIYFQEFLDYVGTKSSHSVLFEWISYQVWMKAKCVLRVVRVAPK